ncbi:hypothetical protein F8M41_026280 [Gigaspora margarita]|uniref:Ion transport domain-containing protein n=1 Tax=Gigaspora margarita TaxID=4874 RepID=A0A8H3XH39_GIGMA|nr:hypothetical protein F8M41_026280 [Gigaspora margarita]
MNAYRKFYYYIVWAIYSTFMGCFLIASTIPENKIFWINQIILLVATIFFGLMFFIFEVCQFIYRPIAYIKSAWNWLDLAAISFLVITSLIWIHDLTPPIWIITISPSYTDDANNPWNLVSMYKLISSNGTVEESLFIETPDDNTNLFSFSTSVLAAYFMLTESFLQLKAKILSEVELFWVVTLSEKKEKWFPEILIEDKDSLPPKILKILKIKDTEEIQDKINKALTKIDKALTKIEDTKETLQSKIDEALINKIDKQNE